jgi:hypothetical protein
MLFREKVGSQVLRPTFGLFCNNREIVQPTLSVITTDNQLRVKLNSLVAAIFS